MHGQRAVDTDQNIDDDDGWGDFVS
jgi:hypothetical protein